MSDMREILFRGKRKDNGEWIYGFFWKDIWGDGESCYILYDGENYPVIPDTRGEYTGLTDKNGIKIFEGDIIKTGDSTVCSVEWDGENARFLGFTAERERRIVYVGREPKAEGIGNIHDNPELLEGDSKE